MLLLLGEAARVGPLRTMLPRDLGGSAEIIRLMTHLFRLTNGPGMVGRRVQVLDLGRMLRGGLPIVWY